MKSGWWRTSGGRDGGADVEGELLDAVAILRSLHSVSPSNEEEETDVGTCVEAAAVKPVLPGVYYSEAVAGVRLYSAQQPRCHTSNTGAEPRALGEHTPAAAEAKPDETASKAARWAWEATWQHGATGSMPGGDDGRERVVKAEGVEVFGAATPAGGPEDSDGNPSAGSQGSMGDGAVTPLTTRRFDPPSNGQAGEAALKGYPP